MLDLPTLRFVTMGSVVEAGLRPDHFPVCKDVVDLAQVEFFLFRGTVQPLNDDVV